LVSRDIWAWTGSPVLPTKKPGVVGKLVLRFYCRIYGRYSESGIAGSGRPAEAAESDHGATPGDTAGGKVDRHQILADLPNRRRNVKNYMYI